MEAAEDIESLKNHEWSTMLAAEEIQNKERPLRETVRDTLRTRIFEGHYAPGTRLVERDLAAEFNVSRLPVREALRMLRQEGLLSDRGARGAEVSSLSPKDVEDLFDVRQSLEVLACRLAAVRATPADLEYLEGLLDEAGRCLAKGAVMEAHRSNSEFHDAITRIADNGFLKSALEPLQGRMHWLFRHVSDLPELIQEHRELFGAIASGDPDRAAAQSASHIGKYREQFPDDFQKTEPDLHRKKK
jgi:DNA-binding GntR family transcriptional regulator